MKGRRRSSAAVGYLNPAKSRSNLTIEVRALTHRVLLQGKRAVGIEYSQNGTLHQAKAKREVLLCGGTINSPQILQLSGIGPGALLQSLGIEVKHDLPGVGENLQDHIGGRIIHRCVDGTVTMNEIYHNWLRRLYAGAEWILAQQGPADDRRRPDRDVRQDPAGTGQSGRAIPVPRRQRGEDRGADAPVPRLHAGRHPLPAGKPRLAAHPVT